MTQDGKKLLVNLARDALKHAEQECGYEAQDWWFAKAQEYIALLRLNKELSIKDAHK